MNQVVQTVVPMVYFFGERESVCKWGEDRERERESQAGSTLSTDPKGDSIL